MASVATITPEGLALLASKQGSGQTLVMAEARFLDDTDTLVHTEPLTASGFVSPDLVSYSTVLAEATGPFTFTKIHWYSNDNPKVKVLEDDVQTFSKVAGGVSYTHNTLLKYSAVASITSITVPAETWQLDFEGHFQKGEADARSILHRLVGRFAALGDALTVSAIAATLIDNADTVGNWTLSGGSGGITVDAADKIEGAASLDVSGHIADAQMANDLGTPQDWSASNGMVARLKSGSATNVIFFLEDSTANRDEWNVVSQTTWTEHELDLASPDVDGGVDLSDVKKFGWAGLDNAVVYNVDAVERTRFNDFALAAGEALFAGVFTAPVGTTHAQHLSDWNADLTAPPVLAPPGTGTRLDTAYLDMYLKPGSNGPVPTLALTVSDAAQADYVDGNGYQHWVEKIADVLRDTGERIQTAMITDKRRTVVYDAADGLAYRTQTEANGDNSTKVANTAHVWNALALGRENKLANGGLDNWQRGTAFAAIADNTYCADQVVALTGAVGCVDIARDTDVPLGSRYSMKFTVAIANNKFGVLFPIEGQFSKALDGQVVSVGVQGKSALLSNLRIGIIEYASGTFTEDILTVSDLVTAWNGAGANPSLLAGCTFANTPANLALGSTYAELSAIGTTLASSGVINRAVFIWLDDVDASAADVLHLAQIRLVLGDVLPPYTPPNPFLDWERCRMFYRLSGLGIVGWSATTNVISCGVTLGPPMNATPAVAVKADPIFFEVGFGNRTGSGTSISGGTVKKTGGQLDVSGFSSALVAGKVMISATTDDWLEWSANL